jgi:Flp pilus assembly protein TadG
MSGQRGSTLVEFALGSTLLLMTLFGAISGGMSVYRYAMIANLAQEGARWGTVRGLTADSTKRAEGTTAQLQTYLRARNPGLPITVTTNANPNTLAKGATLTVTVSSTWLPVTSYAPWSAFAISASSSMRVAR